MMGSYLEPYVAPPIETAKTIKVFGQAQSATGFPGDPRGDEVRSAFESVSS